MIVPAENYHLAKFIPSTFTLIEVYGGKIHIYKHNATGLPMAAMDGISDGACIGGIIFWRHGDNSMNMEACCPLETVENVMKFLDEDTLGKEGTEFSVDDIRTLFITNLGDYMFNTTGTSFGLPFSNRQVGPHVKDDTEEPVTKRIRTPEDTCVVCMDKDANTMVTPCNHICVCSDCSKDLEGTPSAKRCMHCNGPITGIEYPHGYTAI